MLLLSLAGLLAACGQSAPQPSTPAAAPASSAAEKPVSSAPAKPASSAPSAKPSTAAKPASAGASAGAAASNAPIKVGLIEWLSGAGALASKDNVDGFNLYLDSINNTVAGRKVEVTVVDSQGQTDVALTKAKQLVESDRVNILMGLLNTGECYGVAGYAKQAEIPVAVSGNCGGQFLTSDPKLVSPYVVRLTQINSGMVDPTADFLYKAGYKKAIVVTADYSGGLENADAFGSAYVSRGGQIVQELHPAQGTTDYGPFLAQLDGTADTLDIFLPGLDGLKFLDQLSGYADKTKKLHIMDQGGSATNGPNLAQLKDKALGVTATNNYTEVLDTPENQTFLKALRAKYPGRFLSSDIAQGYSAAQVLEAALKKVNGKIEDKLPFMQALYATDLQTAKGHVKLDEHHDIVQNVYAYEIVKNGDAYTHKLLQTYPDVSEFWDRTPDQLAKFPFGKLKGKWVGMTKPQLDQIIATGKV